MNKTKDRFKEIEKEYSFAADTSQDFGKRMHAIRLILEHIVDYFFLNEKIQNDFKKTRENRNSKHRYDNNFGGKHKFLIHVKNTIPMKFAQPLGVIYNYTSEIGAHANLNPDDINKLLVSVSNLNDFISWFYKKINKEFSFLKTPMDFINTEYIKPADFHKIKKQAEEIAFEKKRIEEKRKQIEEKEKELIKNSNKNRYESEKIRAKLSKGLKELETDKISLSQKVNNVEKLRLNLEKEIHYLKSKVSSDTNGFDKVLLSLEETKTELSSSIIDLKIKDEKIKTLLTEKFEQERKSAKEIKKLEIERVQRESEARAKTLKTRIKYGIGVIFLVLIISILIFKSISSPFQMNVSIEKDQSISIHQEYPKLSKEAKMIFYFPNEEIEREIPSLNEMIIPEVPANLMDEKCRIELISPYWKVSENTFTIKPNASTIHIRPNESLSIIEGTINDIFGNPIKGGVVKCSGISNQSNIDGKFKLQIPLEERKLQYTIRIEKAGYIAQTLEYNSGKGIEIRLNKST